MTIIDEPSGLLLERRYLFIYDIKNKDQSIGGKARLGLCLWGAYWVLFSVIRPSLRDLNLNMILFFKTTILIGDIGPLSSTSPLPYNASIAIIHNGLVEILRQKGSRLSYRGDVLNYVSHLWRC